MRCLVTGVQGMAGSHLAEHLAARRTGPVGGIARRSGPHNGCDVTYVLDLRQYDDVLRCVRDFRPDAIFHLAAQAFVPESWTRPQETFANNALSELNLLEAVHEAGLRPVFHIASSSEVYGRILERDLPLREDQPLCPASPYALSKVAQEYAALQHRESRGIRTVITRTFNHTGPRRSDRYVESSLARQLMEIELGVRAPEVFVGNLQAVRDFTDVRDVVRAYADLVLSGAPGGVYHVCSGRAVSIANLLDRLIRLAGLSVKVTQDPGRQREMEIPVVYGDSRKLREAICWMPAFSLDETLRDLLQYWRDKLRPRCARPGEIHMVGVGRSSAKP
jgi:GDP-4-dehydro-6-deoxy-D-mannose reductase